MEKIGILFETFAGILALLAVAILTWANKDKSHSKKVLVIVLLVLSILNINGVVFHTGGYMRIPWMHKIAIPFTLLIYPTAWLYTRSVLKSEITFAKYDWLLLVPAVLFAINLLPYYLMPMEEKRAYIERYYQSSALRSSESEGFLPAYVFAFIRIAWSAFFLVLNYRLIHQFRKEASPKMMADNAHLFRWLIIFNTLLACILAAALFAATLAPIKKTSFNLLDLSLGLFVLVIAIQLFFRPKILYGIFKPTLQAIEEEPAILSEKEISNILPDDTTPDIAATKEEKGSQLTISTDEAIRYKKILEEYFMETKTFLNPAYSLNQLSSEIKIPRYILSGFINREYGMGFREFLNRQRIDYLIAHLDNPKWKNFTIEAIAAECGFSSRTTFSNNFKQITGTTASAYMNDRLKKDNPY